MSKHAQPQLQTVPRRRVTATAAMRAVHGQRAYCMAGLPEVCMQVNKHETSQFKMATGHVWHALNGQCIMPHPTAPASLVCRRRSQRLANMTLRS